MTCNILKPKLGIFSHSVSAHWASFIDHVMTLSTLRGSLSMSTFVTAAVPSIEDGSLAKSKHLDTFNTVGVLIQAWKYQS